MATFGAIAVPDQNASFLSVTKPGNQSESFSSMQIGGGFVANAETPIYLEGYFGVQRYDPLFLGTDGEIALELSPRWTSVGLTGGIGYDFKITETLSVRPILNLSIGHVTSDVAIEGLIAGGLIGEDLSSLIDGGLTAGGAGGALALVYKNHGPNSEYDVILRHSHLWLKPILGSRGIDAEADAINTALWSRATFPVDGWKLFGAPVRSVFEAGVTSLDGDQGFALDMPWLAQIGAGIELENKNERFSVPRRIRAVVRYVRAEEYRGYSIGFGIRF